MADSGCLVGADGRRAAAPAEPSEPAPVTAAVVIDRAPAAVALMPSAPLRARDPAPAVEPAREAPSLWAREPASLPVLQQAEPRGWSLPGLILFAVLVAVLSGTAVWIALLLWW